MKLSKVLSVFAIVALFSLASCKKDKCYVCTQSGSDDVTLCKDEYPGSALGVSALDFAVEAQISLGYTCTEQ